MHVIGFQRQMWRNKKEASWFGWKAKQEDLWHDHHYHDADDVDGDDVEDDTFKKVVVQKSDSGESGEFGESGNSGDSGESG